MSAKHTPGPWEAADPELGADRQWWVVANGAPEGSRLPASCHGPDAKANARLIAAAPDLLAALQELIRIGDRKTTEWDRARAAIAKATGES